MLSLSRTPASRPTGPHNVSHHHPRRTRAGRMVAVVGLAALSGALVLGGIILAATPAGAAAPITINQCNGINASPEGATTGMDCAVTIVNTIDHGVTSSVTTVTRTCTLGPCAPGNGTFTTRATELVTRVEQCNGSGNDAAHPTHCSVTITNNVTADTAGALPITVATTNQCVGSAQGGGGALTCTPFPATTTSATVTQCNGSANGGGGTIDCSVLSTSRVTPAIPVTVDQCNGTANPGGSVLTCDVRLFANVIAGSTSASATASAPSSAPSATTAASSAPSSTSPQVAVTPSGGVAAGEAPTGASTSLGWISTGALLLIASALIAGLTLRRPALDVAGRHA